jgi:hypothetical protein
LQALEKSLGAYFGNSLSGLAKILRKSQGVVIQGPHNAISVRPARATRSVLPMG